MSRTCNFRRQMVLLGAMAGVSIFGASSFAANLTILLPLNRVAYQTNEWIDVSVVRSDAGALPDGNLSLTVTGDDASKMVFNFPVKAAAVKKNEAARRSICISMVDCSGPGNTPSKHPPTARRPPPTSKSTATSAEAISS